MRYGVPAVERAMKMQEIVLRAMSGRITRLQAADILGLSPRTVRRWRVRYRLVNELRVAGITTPEPANAYLRTTFLPAYNGRQGQHGRAGRHPPPSAETARSSIL